MNFLELFSGLVSSMDTTLNLAGRLAKLFAGAARHVSVEEQDVSYENVALDIVVNIRDARGNSAVLQRQQRVRFLTEESGIIRDLVWGEGNPLARYSVRGAHRLDVRPEGSKRVVLLGLDHRPTRGERALILTRRLMQNAFSQSHEYFETFIERPTERLSMKILFPSSRAPKEARLITSPPGPLTRRVPVRYTADRQPFLAWSQRNPPCFRTFSLRWSW